jgi:hypothetical protein
MKYYHVSGGKAYGPSEPSENLESYKARVKKVYGSLRGVTFGTKAELHPAYFWEYGITSK